MAIMGFEIIIGKSKYTFSFYQEIFNVDSKGEKTITSLYYQHILRFFLKDITKHYKVREVANWIVDVVPLRTRKIAKRISDVPSNKSDIVEDREKTIRKYFSQLQSWNLVIYRQVSAEKAGSTFEYQLTPLGNLIALLIEVDFEDDGKKVMDNLYGFLEAYCFDNNSDSLSLFCKNYFKRCRDQNLFHSVVYYLKAHLTYQHRHIYTMKDIFTQMILSRTGEENMNKKLWELWEYSFNQLKEDKQNLLLFHLKLFIDRIIEDNVISYCNYEDELFDLQDNFKMVVIELYCPKCIDKFYLYKDIPILDYLKRLFDVYSDIPFYYASKKINCSNCDGDLKSVII